MCLLVSCGLFYDAFRRFKRFSGFEQILNLRTVFILTITFTTYAISMIVWQLAWLIGEMPKRENEINGKLIAY